MMIDSAASEVGQKKPGVRSSPLLSPQFIFIVLSLLGLLAFTLSSRARALSGILDHGMWFLDSYAVLAASDGNRVGLDPDARNPLDVLRRPHIYSNWWFGLGELGLTREDNFLVGSLWVVSFLVAVFATVKATSRAEAVWLALLVCSPSVFMGVLRANADLFIFVVLAIGLWALRFAGGWRIALAIVTAAFATGLKFYPAAAGLVFLWILPTQWRVRGTLLAVAAIAAVLVLEAAELKRGMHHFEPEIYTFGARILLMDFSLPERVAVVLSLLVLGFAASVAMRRGWTRGLACEKEETRALSLAMTLGAALLVLCFATAVNFGYRWIFSLWVAPWLWANRGESRAARIALWLLPICLWHDALLVLATAAWFPHLRQEQYDTILVAWRWLTEPMAWVLMVMLAGWLLELVAARWREGRHEFGRK